jgi:hypothetical protein
MRAGVFPFLLAALPAVAGIGPALAHHPGSHANRLPDGRVNLEAVATATDACIRIGEVRAGAPPRVAAVAGTAPVTVRLERPNAEACAAVVQALRRDAVLDLPPEVRQILLYILAPDGTLAATERVPVR